MINLQWRPHLAQTIKDVVEEDKDSSSSHFRDVVQRLTGVVSHTSIRILKTRQHWLDQLRKMDTNRRLPWTTQRQRTQDSLPPKAPVIAFNPLK